MLFLDFERTTSVDATYTFRISAEGSQKRPKGALNKKWVTFGGAAKPGPRGGPGGGPRETWEGVQEEVQDEVREEDQKNVREDDHQKCLDVKTQIGNPEADQTKTTPRTPRASSTNVSRG